MEFKYEKGYVIKFNIYLNMSILCLPIYLFQPTIDKSRHLYSIIQ
jgi:hypothetical protein